jgi:hypothetical protein
MAAGGVSAGAALIKANPGVMKQPSIVDRRTDAKDLVIVKSFIVVLSGCEIRCKKKYWVRVTLQKPECVNANSLANQLCRSSISLNESQLIIRSSLVSSGGIRTGPPSPAPRSRFS